MRLAKAIQACMRHAERGPANVALALEGARKRILQPWPSWEQLPEKLPQLAVSS